MSLDRFHPAVSSWFIDTFRAPTECQRRAWPSIQAGRHTLIAAPTGSGKTLAAFLASIDALVKKGIAPGLPRRTQVVYVSPLKALSNDIQRNLEQPLDGIGRRLFEAGHPDIAIHALVRTGDTPPAVRAAMAKNPPHILVTTPESLYLLLTSDSGRRMLKSAETVIVDEIHALLGSKRGAHLALSLERLDHLAETGLTRIGLSATQRPVEEVGRFLTGGAEGGCELIDLGHRRRLDLAIELPDSPLEALLSAQAAAEIYDRLAHLIRAHKSTLIFVNTRRMAERVARFLSERIGAEQITSHHGSLAREQRLDAEARLKAGRLKALVATASLELGIDIGDVDLVCQMGTTGCIATLLQRVGRSGHHLGGLPKGRLFPTSRDELIECIALIDAVRRGELEHLCLPAKPLDVLAQQIVAMVACEEWAEDTLFAVLKKAYPYRELTFIEFEQVLGMLAAGFSTQRGRRAAHLHRDPVHKRLRARRGARLTALTCGGAIPDNAEYRVVLEPGGEIIGSVDEDFAMESLAGDIFQLGNTSWRVLRIEGGNLKVADAGSQPPSIPFWFGEAPGRSEQLSQCVSRLREAIAARCRPEGDAYPAALEWLQTEIGVDEAAARQAVDYIAAAKATLGTIPSCERVVIERFFDESGGMQLILHSPFGSRLNRAWGLGLRKRFCRSFNFELQAAATENAIVLSLGQAQSFPLDAVSRYLRADSATDIVIQALLDAPMFTVRWRWNATCALAVRRFQNGRRTPPYLLRMQAEDLATSIFPEQRACLENISGEREIPDHPLVRQTIDDCLNEAMDIRGLVELLRRIESGAVEVIARDLVEPSPFAAEILRARNYAFLDGAPAEERRTRAVASRRWLDPKTASDLGRLDAGAIARVRAEAWPEVDSADELYDALGVCGFIDESSEAADGWRPLFASLAAEGRAARAVVAAAAQPRSARVNGAKTLWICAERLPLFFAIHPELRTTPALELPPEIGARRWDHEAAVRELLRARLGVLGPATAQRLADSLGLDPPAIEQGLCALEHEGLVLRGRFTLETEETEWCERGLLSRIHRLTLNRLRNEIEPVSAAEYLQFLFRWQRVDPEHRMQGQSALAAVLEQLEGFEAAAGAWESEILRARLRDYDGAWLDSLCLSGRFLWVRLSPPLQGTSPVKSTPVALLTRKHAPLWRSLLPQRSEIGLTPSASRVAEVLAGAGALFFEELAERCGVLKTQAKAALAELAAAGMVTADSFAGLRALLAPEKHLRGRLRPWPALDEAGRWSLIARAEREVEACAPAPEPRYATGAGGLRGGDEAVAYFAGVLLKRYGVVFRAVLSRETAAPPWRDLLQVYRRMEQRGEIRGGRFVAGQYGEQFALGEALETLRKARGQSGGIVTVSAADPLNLLGIITPGQRIAAFAGNRLVFRAGIPLAVKAGGDIKFLQDIERASEWDIRQKLLRSPAHAAARPHFR